MPEHLEFDLAYLALLTQNGLKPLSRWEGRLNPATLQALSRMGLATLRVPRLLQNGTWVEEYIFSRRGAPIDAYARHFYGAPLSQSPRHQRLEGRLFGYPHCCVEHYIRKPYDQNGLSCADQAVLFHWACPQCQATAELLPHYHRIHTRLVGQYRGQPVASTHAPWRQSVAVAASLSLLALGTLRCDLNGITIPDPIQHNPHLFALSAEVDGDGDFLEDRYESLLGLKAGDKDSDRDGILDGPDLALSLLSAWLALPAAPREDGAYVENHMMRGLEQCNVCQHNVNMGYARLVNPLENLEMELPYLFLHHFLEHGSFSYDGTLHSEGRVNAALLRIVLQGDGTSHLLGSPPDPAVQHRARTLARTLESLPREAQNDRAYVIEHQAKGLEMCHCCGQSINMGYLELHHPAKKLHLDIPIIGAHYLHCGGFSYQGDLHKGVIDEAALSALLE